MLQSFSPYVRVHKKPYFWNNIAWDGSLLTKMEKKNPYCIVDDSIKVGSLNLIPFFTEGTSINDVRRFSTLLPTMFYDFYNVTSNFGGSYWTPIPTLKAAIIFTLRRKNCTFGTILLETEVFNKKEKKNSYWSNQSRVYKLIFFTNIILS